MLDREEYVEQAYFFRVLGERLPENVPLQDLLAQVRDETLATTKLPMAIDYLLTELKHSGVISPAMTKLAHYFTPFQTYVMRESENDRSRFDMRLGVAVLRYEAAYRAEGGTPQGTFLYQFETLCRNRLRYDHGLAAMAGDPIYTAEWREWIMTLRRQIGMLDLADMLYLASRHYLTQQELRRAAPEPPRPVLFGEQEGKIALANRKKDPLYLFSALQRQMGYPVVPRPQRPDETAQLLPLVLRRLENVEARIKLLEDEQRGGIDLSKFFGGKMPEMRDEG